MEIKKRKNAATKAAGNIWEDVTHWKGQTVAGLCIKGFAEHTSKTKRPDWYGKTVRSDSAYGHCECRPDVQRSVSIAELKKLHKRGELVPRQKQQQRVHQLLRRRKQAMMQQGIREDTDSARLVIETIELVKLEDVLPSGEMPRYEPFQQYQTYVSPIEL